MTGRPKPTGLRFWAKVTGDEALGCWRWTSSATRDGYGWFWFKGRMAQAHRVAYELMVTEIPDGLELDHLCRVPSCVNPWHLEPVTHSENVPARLAIPSGGNSATVRRGVPTGSRARRRRRLRAAARWGPDVPRVPP